MHWYLVHTKPKQENRALHNLKQQGFECYLPAFPSEKLSQGHIQLSSQPLFPRYLFIRLGTANNGPSWSPIRSTKGISRLVSFGAEPAKVHDALVEHIRLQEAKAQQEPQRLFQTGETVRIADGPFAGLEGIYQVADGESRAMILIQMMSKPVALSLPPYSLQKIG